MGFYNVPFDGHMNSFIARISRDFLGSDDNLFLRKFLGSHNDQIHAHSHPELNHACRAYPNTHLNKNRNNTRIFIYS